MKIFFRAEGAIFDIRQSRLQGIRNYRCREGYYIMIKRSSHQENTAMLNADIPNNRVAKP